MSVKEQVSLPTQRICSRCKFVSSQEVCKACVLLEGLNKGLPKLGIGKSSKAKRMLEEYHFKQAQDSNGVLADAINDLNDTVVVDKNKLSKSRGKRKEDSSENDACNKDKCCGGGGCKSKQASIVDEAKSNKKLNMLLEQYGLDEVQNGDKNEPENIKTNGTNVSDVSDNEQTIDEEDDTCSASCGKLGSLQIGF